MKAAILKSRPSPIGSLPVPGKDIVLDVVPVPELDATTKPAYLCKNLYLSIDPAILGWISPSTNSYLPPIQVGDIMRGATISRVMQTKQGDGEVDKDIRVGDVVIALGKGWSEYTVFTRDEIQSKIDLELTSSLGLPLRSWLGPLGGPGVTAYFGLKEIGKPQKGETVVVSAAAGATGSVVCQIAKNVFGCRVVGIAGGRAKTNWLLEELKLDAVVDYQVESVGELRRQISAACPNGVDVFFDNVGGVVLDEILRKINFHARIVLCGFMSQMVPNANGANAHGPGNYVRLVQKSAKMEGFIALNYSSRNKEAHKYLAQWLSEGKIKSKEELHVGLDQAPHALLTLFSKGSSNRGKVLIQIHDEGETNHKPRL